MARVRALTAVSATARIRRRHRTPAAVHVRTLDIALTAASAGALLLTSQAPVGPGVRSPHQLWLSGFLSMTGGRLVHMSGTMGMPEPAIRLEGEDRPGRQMRSEQPSRLMADGVTADGTSCPASRPAIYANACAPIRAPAAAYATAPASAAAATSASAPTPALASRAAEIADQVEEILDSRVKISPGYRRLEYLTQHKGPYIEHWEGADIMIGHEAVSRFHARHPGKPGPLLRHPE